MRSIATTVCAAAGVALLALAGALDGRWLERHVLTPWYYPWMPSWIPTTRIAVALAGIVLLALAWPLGRALARSTPGGWVRVALAVVLALAVSEIVLRRSEQGTAYWRALKLEFHSGFGRPDPRLGWVLFPSRTTELGPPERRTSYSIDAWGGRAANDRGAPDPQLPSLVVSGESIAVGHGVAYEQTFAAQMGKDLGLQTVNVACGGYGSDQAYLRLVDAMRRLKNPAAVITTFVPVMLSRNVQDYRPRLVLRDGELQTAPPVEGFIASLRLRDLFVNELPYMGEARLRESLELTAAVLRETDRTARAHGAAHLFALISIGPRRDLDDHPEAWVARRLFVEQGLPFVLVDVDPSELIAGDGHPGPVAHRRIAQTLEAALRARLSRAQ